MQIEHTVGADMPQAVDGWLGMDRQVFSGQTLQGNGGFGLELLTDTDAENPGSGVEPASGTAAQRAVEIAREHVRDRLGALFADQRPEPGEDFSVAPQQVQCRSGQAPGFTGSHIAAGQRQRQQMAESAPGIAGHPQQLAAPGCAVAAKAHTVQRQAEYRPVEAMFGHQRGNVRVVMLHRHGGYLEFFRQRHRQLRTVEIRVQVVGDGLGRDFSTRQERIQRRFQLQAALRVAQVTVQRRPQHLIALQQAGGVLQPCATGQHRRPDRRAGQFFATHAGPPPDL